jgi:hypothetical protein
VGLQRRLPTRLSFAYRQCSTSGAEESRDGLVTETNPHSPSRGVIVVVIWHRRSPHKSEFAVKPNRPFIFASYHKPNCPCAGLPHSSNCRLQQHSRDAFLSVLRTHGQRNDFSSLTRQAGDAVSDDIPGHSRYQKQILARAGIPQEHLPRPRITIERFPLNARDGGQVSSFKRTYNDGSLHLNDLAMKSDGRTIPVLRSYYGSMNPALPRTTESRSSRAPTAGVDTTPSVAPPGPRSALVRAAGELNMSCTPSPLNAAQRDRFQDRC